MAVLGAGCGGDGELQVADVLGDPPRGLRVVEADRANLRPLLDPLRKALGKRLRGFETRTVVPKGRSVGTAVVIINSNEPFGDPQDVLEGARDSARDSGGEYEEMTIAGTSAAFVRYDETFQLSVPLGSCAVGMLIDQDRERLLSVARALRAPE